MGVWAHGRHCAPSSACRWHDCWSSSTSCMHAGPSLHARTGSSQRYSPASSSAAAWLAYVPAAGATHYTDPLQAASRPSPPPPPPTHTPLHVRTPVTPNGGNRHWCRRAAAAAGSGHHDGADLQHSQGHGPAAAGLPAASAAPGRGASQGASGRHLLHGAMRPGGGKVCVVCPRRRL